MINHIYSLGSAFFFILIISLIVPVQAAEQDIILRGAGATFPHPLYKKLIEVYTSQTKTRIMYDGVGSGEGIEQLSKKRVDFGATDAYLTDRELQNAPAEILHIPTCLGAVIITYNLPGSPKLQFTPELIADIFLGRITRWSHSYITTLNPQAAQYDHDITIVHRSDSSGTTYIFTNYLSKVSPQWAKKIGEGKKVSWPAGMGVDGNPGVVQMVKKIPGSIGYVELTYSETHNLPVAHIKNRSGNFVKPTLDSVSAAAKVPLPPDTRLMITDTAAKNGYPISAFTYLILYREQHYYNRSIDRARSLVRFLWWIIHQGQRYNMHLLYAPLPREAIGKAENIIRSITYDGRPIPP
jgi:phosphate transport system substrate-binding protein